MQKLIRAASAAFIGAFLLSCGGGESTAPRPVLTTLTVSFPNPTIFVGQSANASASGFDQFGASIGTGTVSWATGSGAIATVSATGVVTGVSAGPPQLIATGGGKQARPSSTVGPAPVASGSVSPSSGTLPL